MSMYVISTSLKIQQQQHFKINLSSLWLFLSNLNSPSDCCSFKWPRVHCPAITGKASCEVFKHKFFLVADFVTKSLSEKMNICPLNLFLCQISATLHVCPSTPSVVDIPAYDIQTQHQQTITSLNSLLSSCILKYI